MTLWRMLNQIRASPLQWPLLQNVGQESGEPLSKRRCGRTKKSRKLQRLVLERPLLERRSEVAEIACRRPACKIKVLCRSVSSPRFAVDCESLKMLSPIAPPPTPILEGAGHLVVDCEPMLAVNTPPQSPVLKIADRESCILVTNEVEVTHEAGAAHEVNVKYKYEARVTHKAEQVRGYPGFLTFTDRNMSEPFLTSVSFSTHVQATIHGSFSM